MADQNTWADTAGDAWADGPMINSYRYTSGGSGGTLLVGAETVYTYDTGTVLNPNYAVAGLFVAVANGTAVTGYCRIKGYGTDGNAKMVIWNSSTGAVIAVSAATAITSTGDLYSFTFSDGTISSGTTYGIGYVADVYTLVAEDGTSSNLYYSENSYTTPTSVTGDKATSGTPEAYVKN